MSIYEKIANKGKAESEKIRNEAEKEAFALEHKIVSSAEKEAAAIIAKAEDFMQNAIAQKQALSALEKRQSTSALKNKVIDDIFGAVYEHFKNLDGSELLAFVAQQIKEEKIHGSETMRVAKHDYDKYRLALSSHEEGVKITLDLLNKKLGSGFTLSLENIPSGEDDGFLLIGDSYDLNFSVKPLLSKMRKDREKELFAQLFDESEE
ncbi:MAG: hypothetical protein WC282_00165 [Bacilli bacterium]|jgi:V/A-type H+-transporting ATPase subunit E